MKELTGKFGTYLMTDDGFYLEKPDGVHWYCNDLVETGQHVLYGCGGRGIGKTHNTRLTAMDQFRIPVEELCNADPKKVEKALDAGEVHRFVYMRRRDKEIQLEKRKMFSRYPYDIRKNWKVNKGNIITYKGMEAGYMIDLDHVRGAGIDFANVNTIINDEFISHKSGANAYLPKEYQIFQGAVDSIIRYDNNTRVFAMSNAVSVYNPYFLNEGYMPTGQKMWQNPARHVAVEWCETSKELLDARKRVGLQNGLQIQNTAIFRSTIKLCVTTTTLLKRKAAMRCCVICGALMTAFSVFGMINTAMTFFQ